MDVKELLLQWFMNFLIKKSALLADKSSSGSVIKMKICQIKS